MCAVKIGRLGKFDLNPRGELWRKDENRFGHKFLTKFGWSQGKGLGKNENGIAENLKVRIKLGSTGVGWDEKQPIGIDYREYDAMLENLSKKYQKPGVVKNEEISLEKRSQQFKNRIHYQKFVRGKDISRYSDKDMNCIFLSRETEKEMESTPKETAVTNIESRPADPSAKESVPTFNSQMSIADYFAMKMKNKMGSSLNTPKESKTGEESCQSETGAKSKKRKHELKRNRKAKRMKHDPELSNVEGSLSYEEENTSESSNSSLEAPEEMLICKEQFENVEECDSESLRKKKKMSKKAKKLLNALKLKQDIENNQLEKVDKTSTENKILHESREEFSYMTEKDISSKKRKKERKNCKKAKKRRLEEVEISSSVEKNSSHSDSDGEEKSSSEESSTKSVITEKQSRKESKKLKNKISNLKSCLKNCLSNNKYSFKEKRKVSFCENISYKIIESRLNNFDCDVVLETNEQLLSCSDEDCTDNEVTENSVMNLVNDSNSSGKSSNGNVQCDNEDVSCDMIMNLVVEDNTVPECFKLPKHSSSNYNSWLETQRIAARMKVYKNMVKKMKRHPVLRKTNLLEIKGYGNWGL